MAGTGGRRGRLPAQERDARRLAVLDAAFAELVERGYEGTTMLGIARRAGASKETLYAWFGHKQGLFGALIRHQAGQATRAVAAALEGEGEPRAVLEAFAIGLLTLLVGERALALNRAAMTSPELAEVLLAEGRHSAGPLVEAYLARLAGEGRLALDDPAEAFRVLYGLVVQDTQIRALLGEPPPALPALAAQARRGVERFLALTAASRGA